MTESLAPAHEVRVAHGVIPVPHGVHTQAEMEDLYRDFLWPRVRSGMKRWRRELKFDGMKLRYAIYDVPIEV